MAEQDKVEKMKRKVSLRSLVERCVNDSLTETLGSLLENEERNQKSTQSKLKPFRHSEGNEDDTDEQDEPIDPSKKDNEESVSMDAEDGEVELKVLSPEEMSEVDVEAIIDEINKMRSGESLKDQDIREQLASYFDVLNVPERKMLFSYLQGLAQIMSQGASGTDAARPGVYKLKAAEIVQKDDSRSAPPKKKPQTAGSGPQPPPEEPSSPAPIVVGERANKRGVTHRLRELMKR